MNHQDCRACFSSQVAVSVSRELFVLSNFAIRASIYRSLRTLQARNPKKRLRKGLFWGVFQRALTPVLLQKCRKMQRGAVSIQIGGVITTFCQGESILLQKYHESTIEVRGVSRYFSKVSGPGVNVTLPMFGDLQKNRTCPKMPRKIQSCRAHANGVVLSKRRTSAF